MLILWSPFMPHDTSRNAYRAAGYVADPRVQHFWDLWKFGSRTYSTQLKIPELQAWDLFVFYRPQIVWKEAPPEFTFWMQARNLDSGEPYSKEKLAEKLRVWLE